MTHFSRAPARRLNSLLIAARRLASQERQATAALLRALMEIDHRRLYLGQGCASMFVYCTQVLHLAEGTGTAGNHAAVLVSAQHKSKRASEELVTALNPRSNAAGGRA